MRNLHLFALALLGGAILVTAGCSHGDTPPSPDQAKAAAQAQIDEINKRPDMPPAAKAQVIGHIEQSLKHELAEPPKVPGRKGASS